jgi:hypothetical protein
VDESVADAKSDGVTIDQADGISLELDPVPDAELVTLKELASVEGTVLMESAVDTSDCEPAGTDDGTAVSDSEVPTVSFSSSEVDGDQVGSELKVTEDDTQEVNDSL